VSPRPFVQPRHPLRLAGSRPPPPSLPAVTQNPSGVLTAYASGHVGMSDRARASTIIKPRSTFALAARAPTTRIHTTLSLLSAASPCALQANILPRSRPVRNFATATNSQPPLINGAISSLTPEESPGSSAQRPDLRQHAQISSIDHQREKPGYLSLSRSLPGAFDDETRIHSSRARVKRKRGKLTPIESY